MEWIDTHCHLDGEEFDDDREAVMQQAREAGVCKIFLPAIDLATSQRILQLCSQHPDYLYPMVGLHPEEVRTDWQQQLAAIHNLLSSLLSPLQSPSAKSASTSTGAASSSTNSRKPSSSRYAGR